MGFNRIICVWLFAVAVPVCLPVVTHGTTYSWDGSSGAQFTNSNNWTPSGVPGAADTATFRLGAVPLYPVWLFQGLFDPVNVTVDRMIVGTNTASFAGGVLTVDSTNSTETGRGLIIGQTASDVAVVNSGLQGLTTVYATLGSAAGSSGTLNVTGGPFSVTGLTPTYDLIVGLYGGGAINVSGGRDVNVSDATMLGLYAGSSGTVSVSGAGSTWANGGGIVYVGGAGSGAIDVSGGGQLTAERVIIANETGGSGDVNVSGANSTLTSTGPHVAVGYRGSGRLDVTAGGSVAGNAGYVGYGTSQDGTSSSGVGTALVDGAESNWTNTGNLYVGSFYTTGTLTISNGGRVSNTAGVIGYDDGTAVADGSVGTVNVTGSTSLWNNSSDLHVGYRPLSDGTLNITNGGRVDNRDGFVGRSGSTGNVTVDGLNSLWNNSGNLHVGYIGNVGSGTLTVTNHGTVQATIISVVPTGEARGNGTLVGDVQNSGSVAPGMSVGTLDITGNYTQSAVGELLVELASAASYDRLEVTGVATLDGTLTVALIDGFAPALGNSFDVLNWGSRSGTFHTIELPALAGGLTWSTTQLDTTGLLSVAGVLGDYNLNGTVDAADYTVWRDTLGQMGTGLTADGDPNGTIDAGDYAVWKMHFGESTGSGSGGLAPGESPGAKLAVPEPASVASWMIAAICGISLAARCPSRKRKCCPFDRLRLIIK